MRTHFRTIEPETLAYNALPGTLLNWFDVNENIKKVKYGTGIIIAGFTGGLSMVNGTSFITNPSIDLRQYVGFKATFNDGVKNAVCWFKAPGTGETWGDSVIVGNDSTFAGASNWANVSLASYDETTGGVLSIGSNAAYQWCRLYQTYALTEAGGRYKLEVDITTITGNWRLLTYAGDFAYSKILTSADDGETVVSEFTAVDAGGIGIQDWGAGASTGVFDNIHLFPLLTPSATGVTGVSETGGSIFNWASIESGFNPSQVSFTVTVTRE